MRKLLVGLLMTVLFITACSDQNTVTTEQVPGVTDTSIKIGAWLPLTGPIASHGITQRIGMNAYFEMINEQGGINNRKIEWIVEDNAYDPQKSVSIARKLVERDKVFAIVGSNGTAQNAATFPYFDKENTPFMPGLGNAPEWWNPVKPYLFGVQVLYENQSRALGRWAAKEGAKSILVVHSDPAYFENQAKNVEPGVKSFDPNIKVEFMPVKFGTTDYAPIALQIQNSKPDAIVIIQSVDELVALAKALDRQNVKMPLYTYAPNVSNDTLELGSNAVEGLRAMSFTVPPTADIPEVEEYRNALKKSEPDARPDYQSLFTWAQAKVFTEALKQVKGPLTRENFIKSLESMKNYETGILPPVTFSPDNHYGVIELQPVMVEKGEWILKGDFIDPSKNW
ncbi:ABC transporter substrate-binding protein [Neobacillus niacini]|uniref:ABC transporter substrate-binding protein n=1 Tax=Neobacillus niacini TaxID=86668 RepID=UPI0007AB662D|nr:ABC transporter substrate-binding protein [Neobacillus niacini]MEC1525009.1 ABC transporter substrate-binding protein [Neobacillus niacini]